MLTDAAALALANILGDTPDAAGRTASDDPHRPSSLAEGSVYVLTMTEVESALTPIEDMLDRIDNGPSRPPNRWLARQAGKEPATTHRRCCIGHAQEWQRQAAHVPLPFERTCERCGSVWRVHYAMRRI